MSKEPLHYQRPTGADDPVPQMRWQTIVACSLLGMGLVCGVGAMVWAQRRHELIAAAISLGIAGVIIYFPYVRT